MKAIPALFLAAAMALAPAGADAATQANSDYSYDYAEGTVVWLGLRTDDKSAPGAPDIVIRFRCMNFWDKFYVNVLFYGPYAMNTGVTASMEDGEDDFVETGFYAGGSGVIVLAAWAFDEDGVLDGYAEGFGESITAMLGYQGNLRVEVFGFKYTFNLDQVRGTLAQYQDACYALRH